MFKVYSDGCLFAICRNQSDAKAAFERARYDGEPGFWSEANAYNRAGKLVAHWDKVQGRGHGW